MDLKLKASQKDNRRYLYILGSNEKIEKAILEYLGVLGFAKSSYFKIEESKGKTLAGIRRESLEDIRSALTLAGIKIEKVSGTLASLKR